MLGRQKIVLTLLRIAKRSVSRLEMVKWLFLLRHETSIVDGIPFYDFLPYQYGPFSFTLYHEINKLIESGLVRAVGSSHWVCNTAENMEVSKDMENRLYWFVNKYSAYAIDSLIDHVYNKFPWYTVNSQREKLAQVPAAESKAYIAGYEGLSVDLFINNLLHAGIKHIVDVRKNPIARRYGFHKKTLSTICNSIEMKYTHAENLGIPSELRQNLSCQSDYDNLFYEYENTTLKQEEAYIDDLACGMQKEATVLICMESDPYCCHRTRIAEKITSLTNMETKSIA